MRNKVVDKERVMPLFKPGITIMIGGFLGSGNPNTLIDWLLESGADDLRVIASDTNVPDCGIGKLFTAKRVSRLIASHIGTNPVAGQQMLSGALEVELVPQGTLAERIRAGGAGLGGVLTDVGIGTEVETDKQKIDIDGKIFLIEKPIKADLALIGGSTSDRFGNIVYLGMTRNFNPVMATAAEIVVAEVNDLVDIIEPERIVTPGVYVDYVVLGEGGR